LFCIVYWLEGTVADHKTNLDAPKKEEMASMSNHQLKDTLAMTMFSHMRRFQSPMQGGCTNTRRKQASQNTLITGIQHSNGDVMFVRMSFQMLHWFNEHPELVFLLLTLSTYHPMCELNFKAEQMNVFLTDADQETLVNPENEDRRIFLLRPSSLLHFDTKVYLQTSLFNTKVMYMLLPTLYLGCRQRLHLMFCVDTDLPNRTLHLEAQVHLTFKFMRRCCVFMPMTNHLMKSLEKSQVEFQKQLRAINLTPEQAALSPQGISGEFLPPFLKMSAAEDFPDTALVIDGTRCLPNMAFLEHDEYVPRHLHDCSQTGQRALRCVERSCKMIKTACKPMQTIQCQSGLSIVLAGSDKTSQLLQSTDDMKQKEQAAERNMLELFSIEEGHQPTPQTPPRTFKRSRGRNRNRNKKRDSSHTNAASNAFVSPSPTAILRPNTTIMSTAANLRDISTQSWTAHRERERRNILAVEADQIEEDRKQSETLNIQEKCKIREALVEEEQTIKAKTLKHKAKVERRRAAALVTEKRRRKKEMDLMAEEQRRTKQKALAAEERRTEEARLKKNEEGVRLKTEEDRRRKEATQAAHLVEEERKKEEARLSDEETKKEEARLNEKERTKEEAQLKTEEDRKKEEARLNEEERKKEEARLNEEERKKEEARVTSEQQAQAMARQQDQRQKAEAVAEQRAQESLRKHSVNKKIMKRPPQVEQEAPLRIRDNASEIKVTPRVPQDPQLTEPQVSTCDPSEMGQQHFLLLNIVPTYLKNINHHIQCGQRNQLPYPSYVMPYAEYFSVASSVNIYLTQESFLDAKICSALVVVPHAAGACNNGACSECQCLLLDIHKDLNSRPTNLHGVSLMCFCPKCLRLNMLTLVVRPIRAKLALSQQNVEWHYAPAILTLTGNPQQFYFSSKEV
jgi:hypothetical protein